MAMDLKDIKSYVNERKAALKHKISLNMKDKAPSLAIIQVGENEASTRYMRNKVKDCKEVGIKAEVYFYPENTTEFELVDEIEHLVEFYDGVMVQLPLPPHIRVEAAIAAIPQRKRCGWI